MSCAKLARFRGAAQGRISAPAHRPCQSVSVRVSPCLSVFVRVCPCESMGGRGDPHLHNFAPIWLRLVRDRDLCFIHPICPICPICPIENLKFCANSAGFPPLLLDFRRQRIHSFDCRLALCFRHYRAFEFD